jgi:hypothetical protein
MVTNMKKLIIGLFLLSFCVPVNAGQINSKTAGLLNLWHFNGGATLVDSVGNNNGTITGMGYTYTGKLGGEGDFDTDSVAIATLSGISSNQNFTFSCWIKTASNGAYVAYYGNTNILCSHQASYTRSLAQTDGKIMLVGYGQQFTGGVDADRIGGNIVISDNKWHQVVWTGTSAGITKVYIDAVLDINGTFNNTNTGTTATKIGRNSDGATQYWVGKIDELAIFNRCLSAAEIKAMYNDQLRGRKTKNVQ